MDWLHVTLLSLIVALVLIAGLAIFITSIVCHDRGESLGYRKRSLEGSPSLEQFQRLQAQLAVMTGERNQFQQQLASQKTTPNGRTFGEHA